MKTTEYISRPYVNPFDLETLGKTFNTLEEGHLKAVEAASALQATMAQLDLNSAEDTWRQGKVAEIQNSIDNNTIYGNSYGALDDLIKMQGNLMSDPGLKGRLEAQKAYKTFQNAIDTNTSISERDKRYYKAHNPYRYNDTLDENGNVIGGSEWTPNITPIGTPDYGKLVIQAANMIKPRTGSTVVVRYLNDNGEIVSENDPTAKPEYGYYDMTTNQYVTIPRSEIEKAVTGLIRSTPEFLDAVKRDKDITFWDYKEQLKDTEKYNTDEKQKQLGVSLGITNNVGREFTLKEFIGHKMNPLIDAASYYNAESSTKYGKAYETYNKIKGIKQGNSNGVEEQLRAAGLTAYDSYPIVFKDQSMQDAFLHSNIYKQEVSDLLGRKYDITDMSDQDIYNTEEFKKLSPKDKTRLQYAMSKYQENQRYLNSKKEKLSIDDQDKMDAYYAINTGYKGQLLSNDGENNNKYYQRFQNIINKYYNGASSIRQYINHKNGENAFYEALGGTVEDGKRIARDLGIIVGKNRGMTYFELPAEYANNLPAFADAAKTAYNEHSLISFTSQKSKLFTVDDSGNEHKLSRSTGGDMRFYSAAPTVVFADLSRALSDLKTSTESSLRVSDNVAYSDYVFNTSSPTTAFMYMNGSDQKDIDAQTEQDIINLQGSFDPVNTGLYVLGKDNFLAKVNSEDRQKYGELFRNADVKDIIMQMRWDPVNNNYGAQVTIRQNKSDKKNILGKEDSEPVVLFIPNNSNTFENDMFSTHPSVRAKDDLITYADRGMDVEIASDIYYRNPLVLHSNGDSYSIIEGDEIKNIISKEEGIAVRSAYINLEDTILQYINGLINENDLTLPVVEYVSIISAAMNDNEYQQNPEQYVKDVSSYLLKNILNN